MENLKTNPFSHLTAKERESISFPARYCLGNKLIFGTVLDFGCGFGKDVEVLKNSGIEITGYDPLYFPKYPTGKFDTILCFYVLNVLMQEEQSNVLMDVSQLLKPTGKAYFAVRRDLLYEGFRIHKVHKKPTYQCNVRLPYRSIFKNETCEIYEYQHFNQIRINSKPACIFCNPDGRNELIVESATAYAIYDNYPVSKGHALIIPKSHSADYFQLTFREQSACWYMLNRVVKILKDRVNPDGFNIGINNGQVAGQTVSHVHIHIIPRYRGDIENPIGGVRGVIPNKRIYK